MEKEGTLKSKRLGKVLNLGDSTAMTLTKEFELIGAKPGEELFISVVGDRIAIRRREK